jgi:hypothetical protein
MKYQVGDRVKIKSFDWFRNGACIGFSTLMSKYCGEVLTIRSKNNTNDYRMIEDGGLFCWTDDMIEGMVNISKLGTAANPVEPKLNANCSTWEKVDGLATKIDKELPAGDQNVWELPDGYQFVDENGNVINATKIALEKKKTEYPKTYEECVKILVLGVLNELKHYSHNIIYKIDSIVSLHKLLICRDAYWMVYGEENGLEKPWEPDWREERYIIYRNQDYIIGGYREAGYVEHHIFEFPTKEMRDQFEENFNKELEICKEFL